MSYIMDSSSLKYILDEFPKSLIPKVWEKFEKLCEDEIVISDREVINELALELNNAKSIEWVEKNKKVFQMLTTDESVLLGNLINEGVFSQYENSDRIIQRKLPEAIPFIIAKAKHNDYTIVYRKNNRNESTIIDICNQKNIKCCEVEDFLIDINKS